MIDFASSIILENKRVLLRPLLDEDYALLVPYAISEPTLWKYSLQSANSEVNMKRYVTTALEKRRKLDSYPFIVIDKRDNSVAGSTRFYDFQETHNTIQLGYTWYGNTYWGTGLNKNCKFLLLEYAFGTCGFARVEFRADNTNKRSIAAMKSLGCTVEGILRSNCASENGRRDSIILSILKEEWETHIKDSLWEKISRQSI